jgi:hypothetical protein
MMSNSLEIYQKIVRLLDQSENMEFKNMVASTWIFNIREVIIIEKSRTFSRKLTR